MTFKEMEDYSKEELIQLIWEYDEWASMWWELFPDSGYFLPLTLWNEWRVKLQQEKANDTPGVE